MENLIIDYLSGEISPGKLKELQDWISASPENEKQFLSMQEIWFSSISASDEQRFNKDDAYEYFLAHVDNRRRKVLRKNRLSILWRSAAAIALLLVASYTTFRIGSNQKSEQKNVLFADTNFEIAWGSQGKTTLPDGTIVWLNAASKLTYSQNFGIDNRNVYLTGEGYFEVTHNKDLPLTVHAGDLFINVLGTKFNVRNYSSDSEVTVSLLEGKVSIANDIEQSKEIVMKPNQKIFYDKNSANFHLTDVIASHAIEWTKGYLFYDEELLSDIAKDLERSYDVKITVHPDVANLRFYGGFNRKEKSIEEIIDILASISKITYCITGKEIIIK